MKAFLTPVYAFTPGAAGVGTVDLSSIPNFDIKRLVAIINQTSGVLIYSTASATKKYTNEALGVVTLAFSTASMNAADKLQVIYEDVGQKTSANSSPVALSSEQEAKIDNLITAIGLQAKLTDTQPVSFAPGAGAATEVKQDAEIILFGALTETAPVTDTASSGLNGRLQRIAQRLTSLMALLPASLGQKTSAASLAVVVSSDQSAIPVTGPLTDTQIRATALPVSGTFFPATQPVSGPLTDTELRAVAVPVSGSFFQATQPVSVAALPLPSGAATSANQATEQGLYGALAETAPASDTASSGLNGRLQRIAQRLTSLIALLPTSLGQKTMANSLAVTFASDQTGLAVTQSALTGSFQEDISVTTSSEQMVAPAGAKWVKIQAPSTNSANLRIKFGVTIPTTTSGLILEPGRSEDFPIGTSFYYLAESGTQQINATFGA